MLRKKGMIGDIRVDGHGAVTLKNLGNAGKYLVPDDDVLAIPLNNGVRK